MSGKANARAAANAAASQCDEQQLRDGLNHLQLLHTKVCVVVVVLLLLTTGGLHFKKR